MVSDMEVSKVADKVAYMVADMFAKMVADKKKRKNYINISMEIQFGERVGHKGWLIRPKIFDQKLTRLACLLSFVSLFLNLHLLDFCS